MAKDYDDDGIGGSNMYMMSNDYMYAWIKGQSVHWWWQLMMVTKSHPSLQNSYNISLVCSPRINHRACTHPLIQRGLFSFTGKSVCGGSREKKEIVKEVICRVLYPAIQN